MCCEFSHQDQTPKHFSRPYRANKRVPAMLAEQIGDLCDARLVSRTALQATRQRRRLAKKLSLYGVLRIGWREKPYIAFTRMVAGVSACFIAGSK
jgi:hypothetical protein